MEEKCCSDCRYLLRLDNWCSKYDAAILVARDRYGLCGYMGDGWAMSRDYKISHWEEEK